MCLEGVWMCRCVLKVCVDVWMCLAGGWMCGCGCVDVS